MASVFWRSALEVVMLQVLVLSAPLGAVTNPTYSKPHSIPRKANLLLLSVFAKASSLQVYSVEVILCVRTALALLLQ
jgi:hypothetical protein